MTNNENTQKSVLPASASTAPKQDNANSASASQDKAGMLNAEIKKTWSKLTDEDVKLYDKQPDQFFSKLKEKHNISTEDAMKRMTQIKAACGCTEKAA